MTRRRFPVGKTLLYVFMSLWALTTIYPFIWVILNSFKPRGLIRSDTFSLPIGDKFTLENYVTAFKRVDIGTAYVNSIVISGAVTVVVMVLAGLAAYAMVRYSFRLRGFLHSMIIASMMFPVFSTIIPVFRMESSWGIVNTGSIWLTRLSVVLPQIAGNLSFAIIVLMGFIRSLPVDLEEAAYLEGYNVYQIFFRIIMPLAKPALPRWASSRFCGATTTFFYRCFSCAAKIFHHHAPAERDIQPGGHELRPDGGRGGDGRDSGAGGLYLPAELYH